MNSPTMWDSMRTPARLAVLAAIGATLAAWPSSAAAQARAGVVPAAGAWCGVNQDAEPVILDVSGDGKFVLGVHVLTAKGAVGTREAEVQGVTDSQVVDSKFIFRQRRDETVCERERGEDPRNPRERCRTFTIEDTTIRGTFADPNHVSGSYSAQNVFNPQGGGDDPPRDPRGRPSRRMISGTYTAWPVGFAPCP